MKKLFAALGAVILAATLAAPGAAEAANIGYHSMLGNVATSEQGASMTVSPADVDIWVNGLGTLDKMAAASNYQEPAEGGAYLGTFKFAAERTTPGEDVTVQLVFSVGKQYAGRTATVYCFSGLAQADAGGDLDPRTVTVGEDGTFAYPVTVNHPDETSPYYYYYTLSVNVEPVNGELTGEVLYPATTGANATVTAKKLSNTTGSIKSVMPTDKIASNYHDVEGNVVLGSFEITGDAENFQLVYNVDKKYAGMTAMLFIEHGDGKTESAFAPVSADGTVTFAVDRLSVYTLVIDTTTKPTDNAGTTTGTKKPVANKDTSSKSPVTSARSGNAGLVAAGSAVALAAAAGCAAFAFRKVNGR